MRLLLALLLSAALAPAASANPARELTQAGVPGAVVLSGDRVHAWGHDGKVPGNYAQAYSDGRRRVAVLVNLQPLSERREQAVRRAVVEAFCS